MRPPCPAFVLVLLPLALLGCAAAKPDSLVSAAMQQDCSVLNLDRGLPYCRALPGPPEPPPFCTRSRGSVDCWRQPPLASPPYRGLADTPAMPPLERQPRPWPRLTDEADAARPAEPVRAVPATPPLTIPLVAEPARTAPAIEPGRVAPPTEPAPRMAPAGLVPAGTDRPT